jgi:hypothetical protein
MKAQIVWFIVVVKLMSIPINNCKSIPNNKNKSKEVSFNVGKRTNKTLNRVLETLKLAEAKKKFTDRLEN